MTPPLLLLLADDTRSGLVAQIERLRAMALPALLSSLARSSRAPAGRERLAIVSSPERIESNLARAAERLPSLERPRFVSRADGVTFTRAASPGRIAFLFPGQGSEYVGMLTSLRDRFNSVAGWLAGIDRAADEAGEPPLTPLLTRTTGDTGAARHVITDMERGAQLGTVADLALHEIVTSLGVRADAHVGHSNGEHPAVIAAGRVAWSRTELCRWFVRVGRAGRQRGPSAPPERLIAVSAFEQEALQDLLTRERGRLFHAMDNCPTQQVIGGLAETADAAARTIVRAGGLAVPLLFRRAYHTPLFADWAATLAACYDELPLAHAGSVPVYSCLRAAPLPDEPAACRHAMAAQWTALVRFRATVERLYADGFRTFVEVGPDANLTAFVEDSLRDRPHVAVSASSVALGELVQLHHLSAALFAAGCAIDPAPLATDGAHVANVHVERSAAEAPSRVALAAMHQRLIADGRARLARARATWLAAQAATPSSSRAGDLPLLGAVISDDASTVRARRILTRRDDPFVDNHAFGRRPLVEGAYALPVVPFTGSLELVAEAASRLLGTVAEIRDARASRWLALDFGRLTLDTEARRDGDDVRVRVWDADAGARDAAFEAICSSTPSILPVDVGPDSGAAAPRVWDADTFYARYAFHGAGFRGLSRVARIGSSGIEAAVTITANPGLPLSAVVLDPAMLDCAGQLVAFWLLEHGRLDPSFGVFPYAVRRVTITQPPPASGTRVRARGRIVRRGPTTESRFVFETAGGAEIAALDGFLQRIIPLPGWLAALVFGGASLADVAALIDRRADAEVLSSNGGIWERALAHLCLTPDDLDQWKRMPSEHHARADWLLAALTTAHEHRRVAR